VAEFLHDHRGALLWVACGSAVLFVAALFAAPAVLLRIPADYFVHKRRPPGRWSRRGPVIRALLLVAKNTLGALLILAGIAMLALPGQGLLTILVGFFLIDVPGKYRAEKWVVSRGPVFRAINWVRRKRGREPLQRPERAA
jgi:hypothetical protein